MLPYFEADTPFELKLDSIGNDHRDETVPVAPYLLPPEVEALTVKTTLRAEERDAKPARLLLRYEPFERNRPPRTVLPAPPPPMREVPPIAFKEDYERGAKEQINP